MSAPIIVPYVHTQQRQPTFYERLNSAATEYSSLEIERKSFMDGAKWAHHKDDSGPLNFFLMSSILCLAVLWITTFLLGMAEGASGEELKTFDRPGHYLFWPQLVGQRIGRFLWVKE